MALRRITDAATEPVTTAEAKAHMRITVATEDALIDALIKSVRQACENELGRALITQTWKKSLDQFPDAIELPYPPIIGVTSVYYLAPVTGVTTLLSAASYTVDAASEPGWLVPAYGYDWPTPQDVINAVEITYTAGYGAAAAVPESIKAWIKCHVGNLYENRETTIIGASVVPLPFLDGLLDPYRVVRIA
jgi:uncharacterized phiE125 gp8 family phage protein